MVANFYGIDFTAVPSIMMPRLVLFGLKIKSHLEQMKLCWENRDLKSGCGKNQVLRSSITLVMTVCLWQINTAMISKSSPKTSSIIRTSGVLMSGMSCFCARSQIARRPETSKVESKFAVRTISWFQ